MSDERTIYVTQQDKTRLEALLGGPISARNQEAAEALESELVQAKLVAPEEIPPDVVTMNSKVRFVDEDSSGERVVTLVYPKDADPAEGKVSVLAPVGAALLGLAVGQSIQWPMPGGRVKRFRIEEVLYQPEAAGETDLGRGRPPALSLIRGGRVGRRGLFLGAAPRARPVGAPLSSRSPIGGSHTRRSLSRRRRSRRS